MRKALQIAGVFAAFVLILFGGVVMMGMGIKVLSLPMLEIPAWHVYRLEFNGSPTWFYLGCLVVSAGATFLWFQGSRREK